MCSLLCKRKFCFQWAKLFCILFRSEIRVLWLPTKTKSPVHQSNFGWIILELKSTLPDFQGVRRSNFSACFVLWEIFDGWNTWKHSPWRASYPWESSAWFDSKSSGSPFEIMMVGRRLSFRNGLLWGVTVICFGRLFASQRINVWRTLVNFLSTTKALTAHVWLGFC